MHCVQVAGALVGSNHRQAEDARAVRAARREERTAAEAATTPDADPALTQEEAPPAAPARSPAGKPAGKGRSRAPKG